LAGYQFFLRSEPGSIHSLPGKHVLGQIAHGIRRGLLPALDDVTDALDQGTTATDASVTDGFLRNTIESNGVVLIYRHAGYAMAYGKG